MQRTASSDRLTVIAIAVVAYAAANVCHELVGHCTVAALVGTRCTQLSSTDIPLVEMPPTWKYNIIVAAGCTSNFTFGLVSRWLLRARPQARPALRYFLWLFMSVSLLLPSGYVAAAPVIRYGDSYILISGLPGEMFWRCAVALAGGCLLWLSFRVCRAELVKLTGGGREARRVGWGLVVPAYVAGGVLWVTSGLFSQLEFQWAQRQAAGGSLGLTVWLLLLPLMIPETATPTAEHPFVVPRSVGWVAAGALVAAAFIGLLGPGVPL